MTFLSGCPAPVPIGGGGSPPPPPPPAGPSFRQSFVITGPGTLRNGPGKVIRWRVIGGATGATTLYDGCAWGDQAKNPAFYSVISSVSSPSNGVWNAIGGAVVGTPSTWVSVLNVYISQPSTQTVELDTVDAF